MHEHSCRCMGVENITSLLLAISYLFLGSAQFHKEVHDAKVLQSLPVADVLQLGILDTEIQHGGMGFQHLTNNLGWVEGGREGGSEGGNKGKGN